jgi:hypothetical protein
VRKAVSQSVRTTVIVNEKLLTRATEHVEGRKKDGEKDSFTNLLQRALVNQLEKEGDFEVRDLVEGEEPNGD